MKSYNFDEPIFRKGTSSYKWDNVTYPSTIDMLPMPVADMDFKVADEIIESLNSVNEHAVIGYSLPDDELKTLIQQKLKEDYHWDTLLDWQVWIPGIVPGITAACAAFATSERGILTAIPVYHPFHLVASWLDKPLKTFQMIEEKGRWTFDFVEFETQLKEGADVFLFCNPHNPGGTIFNQDEILRIQELCAKYDCKIISDEIHADIRLNPQSEHICIGNKNNFSSDTISFFSTTKAYNTAGLGIAVAIIPDEKIRQTFLKHTFGYLPMLSRHAIEMKKACLKSGKNWLEQMLNYVKANEKMLLDFIASEPKLKAIPLEGTYLAWIQYEKDLGDFQQKLYANGLHVLRGDQFLGKNFVRLNLATTKENMQKAIGRLKKTIDENS
jgi:cystathionine beta-lyase